MNRFCFFLLFSCLILSLRGSPVLSAAAFDDFILSSEAFEQEGAIPEKYTCMGSDMSPDLAWTGAPDNAQSFALVVEDPDAPKGTYTHWVAYNIPLDKRELPSNLSDENRLGELMMQGLNDFGKTGYGGPCPPQGHGPHRYYFRIFALDMLLNIQPGASKADLESAMHNHILDQAELMGRFEAR